MISAPGRLGGGRDRLERAEIEGKGKMQIEMQIENLTKHIR
jgi:hypothetical protein